MGNESLEFDGLKKTIYDLKSYFLIIILFIPTIIRPENNHIVWLIARKMIWKDANEDAFFGNALLCSCISTNCSCR